MSAFVDQRVGWLAAVCFVLAAAPVASQEAGLRQSHPTQLDAPRRVADDDAPPDSHPASFASSFLIGRYEPAYFLESASRCTRSLRFFAARIPVGENEITVDDIDSTLEQASRWAARIVRGNRISLAPIGVVHREVIALDAEWAILGVQCPDCEIMHWTAVGYNGLSRRHEIHTNSRHSRLDLDDPSLRWEYRLRLQWVLAIAHPVPSLLPPAWAGIVTTPFKLQNIGTCPERHRFPPYGYWVAPLDEGGWAVVSFADSTTADRRCHIKLRIGLSRENGDVTFAFEGPKESVRMIGDYTEKPLVSRSNPNHPYDEQVQYYAVVASNPELTDQASSFARSYIRGAGKTLHSPMLMNRYRLTREKTLTLGVENTGRNEYKEFVIAFNRACEEWRIERRPSARQEALEPGESWHSTSTGGFQVELQITRDPEVGEGLPIEFLFLMPK